jgi:RNA polymerase sigma-70 factor (ECF subfamily)
VHALLEQGVRLERWLDEAHAAHPGVSLPEQQFIAALAERLRADSSDALALQLERLHPSDLFLAQACVHGDQVAIERLESLFGTELCGHARRFANSRHSVDDLMQILREKLFVEAHSGRPPKLTAYSGQGPLRAWLTVTAMRTFLDCSRSGAQHKRETAFDGEVLEALMAPGDDVEIAFLKDKYRADFRAAFSTALRSLQSSERNLLRHHWLAGLSIDQIGVIYHTHRSTVARRLARAREALMSATRRELMSSLGLENDELDSVMALISSRLEVSVFRLLGERTELPSERNAAE